MKKYLWALCVAGLTAPAWADEEVDVAVPADSRPAPQAKSAGSIPPGAVPVEADPGCAPCKVKVCVPETTKTKTSRVYYECDCKDYCLPKCPFPCFWKKKCSGDCGEGHGCCNCGKPRVRKVLIKKSATEETETTRCVPKSIDAPPCVPDCDAACPPGSPTPCSAPGLIPEPVGAVKSGGMSR